VGAVGAVAYIANEFKKRDDLVKSGEECMVGDEQACGLYDEAVEATPIWKLKIVAPKLALTNTVADKFGGPPPKGFEWGKQY